MLGMEEASLIGQRNRGIMGEEEEEEELGSVSSFGDDDGSTNSTGSSTSTSDFMEDATSSTSTLSPEGGREEEGPLYEMSTLIAQLPFKRGLSRHFEGKSQSFTCLSSVMSLEDLAKPERLSPSQKRRLKTCKSYAGGLADSHKALTPKGTSRTITKKASRGSLSALGAAKRMQGFQLASKPPIPPHRSASQTILFA